MPHRIALVGASSTGKTTVFELLKKELPQHRFSSEIARTAKSYGFPINEGGTDLTQLVVSNLHLEALLHPGNLVLDRCYLDLVVYTDIMRNLSPGVVNYIHDTWKKLKSKYTHYIYFPIEFDLVKDGVRSEDEEWRREVDRRFKDLLEEDCKYLQVSGSPQERINQIIEYVYHND